MVLEAARKCVRERYRELTGYERCDVGRNLHVPHVEDAVAEAFFMEIMTSIFVMLGWTAP